MNNLLIAAVAVGVAYLVWQDLEAEKKKKAAAGAGMKEQLEKIYPEEKEKFRADVEPVLSFGGEGGWVKKFDVNGVTYSPQSIEWEIVSGRRP